MKKFTLLLTVMSFLMVAVNAQPIATRSGKINNLDDNTSTELTKAGKVVYFSDDFEADTTASAWTMYDEDGDGHNWFPTETNTTGWAIASASYDNTEGALTPNNWLVSPAIDLSNATGDLDLLYTVYAQDPDWAAEHYKVMVSTTDNSVGSFTDSLFEETIDSNIYERALDLSGYAGETIYIAFQHYDVTDMFRIILDNIQVAEPVTYDVTFNVDMRPAVDSADFVIGEDTLNLTGSITGWTEPIAGPEYILEDPDGDTIYSVVLPLEEGEYEYKYFVNSSWDNGEWDGGDNRMITVEGAMTVDDVFGVEPVGIFESPKASEMNVYPNPSNGIIKVEAQGANKVTVISAIGQVITSQEIQDQGTINLTDAASGVYFVRVQNGDRMGVRRVVIE